MSKYAIARSTIESLEANASTSGVDPADQLLALLVCTVERYAQLAGSTAAKSALAYESDNLSSTVDTVFLRSR